MALQRSILDNMRYGNTGDAQNLFGQNRGKRTGRATDWSRTATQNKKNLGMPPILEQAKLRRTGQGNQKTYGVTLRPSLGRDQAGGSYITPPEQIPEPEPPGGISPESPEDKRVWTPPWKRRRQPEPTPQPSPTPEPQPEPQPDESSRQGRLDTSSKGNQFYLPVWFEGNANNWEDFISSPVMGDRNLLPVPTKEKYEAWKQGSGWTPPWQPQPEPQPTPTPEPQPTPEPEPRIPMPGPEPPGAPPGYEPPTFPISHFYDTAPDREVGEHWRSEGWGDTWTEYRKVYNEEAGGAIVEYIYHGDNIDSEKYGWQPRRKMYLAEQGIPSLGR